MADTVLDTTIEGEIINDVWESLGDTDSNNRHISSSSLWRFLRMAVEKTDDDMDGWDPTAISTQTSFVISPVPTQIQIDCIKACVIFLIMRKDFYGRLQDGVGIVFRGGMDSVDSKTLLIESKNAFKEAKAEYKDQVFSYNSDQSGGLYDINDVYDTGRPDTITVN